MATLRKITIEGYKSIKQMSLELRQLNVLIGANGAGKSNLVSFFALIRELVARRFQVFVAQSGGGNGLLHYGAKNTPQLKARLDIDLVPGTLAYTLLLAHAAKDTLIIEKEGLDSPSRASSGLSGWIHIALGEAILETGLPLLDDEFMETEHQVSSHLRRCHVFHFNDTTQASAMRRSSYIHDNRSLAHDAGNLASFLYRMKETEPVAHDRTIRTIQQAMPWFGDFVLKPLELNKNNVQLDWHERGSDVLFGPHQLPDGALRAMALFTLLLQPEESLPRIMVIDEPELGLHPFAINALAGLVQAVSHHCQVILATQSVSLLEHFDPEDVIVVDREDGASTFKRLRSEDLQEWLDDYTLGQLWQKNVIGGGPV